MADLYEILSNLEGVTDAYLQGPGSKAMEYPCIVYERDDSYTAHADNGLYYLMKRFTVTVIDRDPVSLIPDQVEALPYCSFTRGFRRDGLNHFVFQLFF